MCVSSTNQIIVILIHRPKYLQVCSTRIRLYPGRIERDLRQQFQRCHPDRVVCRSLIMKRKYLGT